LGIGDMDEDLVLCQCDCKPVSVIDMYMELT